MGKTLVNKHTDDINKILDGSMFSADYALGEIVILNGEKPTLYMMTENGPKPLVGGVDEEVINDVKVEITTNYTNADNRLKQDLLGEISEREILLKADVDLKLAQTEAGVIEADNDLRNEIEEAKNIASNYTVNNIPIHENPFLTGFDISVGEYSETPLETENRFENVVTDDLITTAIKKVETMVFANALAMSAALNNVNTQIRLISNEIEEGGEIELLPYTITKINTDISSLTVNIPEDDDMVSCRVLIFKTSSEIGEIVFPTSVEFSTMQLSEIQTDTYYMVEFQHKCAIWTKLYKL